MNITDTISWWAPFEALETGQRARVEVLWKRDEAAAVEEAAEPARNSEFVPIPL